MIPIYQYEIETVYAEVPPPFFGSREGRLLRPWRAGCGVRRVVSSHARRESKEGRKAGRQEGGRPARLQLIGPLVVVM